MLNSIIPFQIFSPIIGKCQKRPFSEMIDRFEILIYLLEVTSRIQSLIR